MALYEFRCPACGKITPASYPISSDIKIHECECGAEAEKIISASNFNVKGHNAANGYSKESEFGDSKQQTKTERQKG